MTSGKYLFDAGVLLYSKLRPYLRKVAIADFRGLCSADMYPLRFDRSRVDLTYAKFALLAEDFTSFAVRESERARMPKLNREQLLRYEMPLPTPAVQERIARRLTERLSAADRARAAARERLAAAEALPAAYLREVFEGPEASSWVNALIGSFADVSGGMQKQPDRKAHTFHRPYLTVRNVQRGTLDLSHVERFEVTSAELERLRLRRGDILIVEGNGSPDQIGRNAIFDLDGEEWIHQNHVIRVRLSDRADPLFVSKFLNSDGGRHQMLKRAQSTSGLFTLSVEKVKSLEVPLPSREEQARVSRILAQRLSAAEHLSARLREELAAIDALPAALLREAFGGGAVDG